MKILVVSHSSVIEYHQQKLVILAEEFGFDITLAAPPYWYEGGVKKKLYTGSKSIKYARCGAVVFKKHMNYFYLNTNAVLKKIRPDVVHVEEEPFNMACFQFVRGAKKQGIKTLFFTWENIMRDYGFLRSRFEKYVLKNADAAAAGNAEGADILKQKGFNGPVKVIPQYGLNPEDFSAVERNGSGKNIVYAGRLIPEKGVEILLKAVSGLENTAVNLIGTGEPGYVSSLKELARELNISDRVFFHGYTDRDKMKGIMSEMDIFVLPSLTAGNWKEQFGRVIIEAFASKIPVIGSSSGEIPHVIGDAGLVFEEGNAADLGRCIKKLSDNSGLRRELAIKGYNRMLDRFTNRKIAGMLSEFYRSI
ncbi:MAG: glycosyltransferase family 4 protein [Candidatus Goldiibacteriota bacterium]